MRILILALSCGLLVQSRDIPLRETEWSNIVPGCTININGQLPRPQPLVLIPGTNRYRYPAESDRLLQLESGEALEVVCQRGFNVASGKRSMIISCVSGITFSHDNAVYRFNDLSCTENWSSSARYTTRSCEQGASLVEIGFDLGDRFVNVMDVCHNNVTFENHWIKHEFHRAHDGFQQGVPRPPWIQGSFYSGINVNQLYTINRQRETLGHILKSTALADQLVQNVSTGVYMARGHIAARADFIYGTQQNATFWFLNAAPQWQNFNDGNWKWIEDSSRRFVATRNIQVTVYGGTFGVQTQIDANGDEQPIYLNFDPTGTQRLPAPKIYYKILHDERNKAGIVLIGVNNVHVDSVYQVQQEYIFCDDIGDKVDWINWRRTNLTLGFSYACEVNPFLKRIGHLKGLDVPNLLI
ncbi:uncharacterized protein LOC129767188 [Toxorhynchites rutilus septentrionalis]|uniref:uncharacterized protein LOC129767188 n=1 Tax=Toxorhynchites rutilus septentrionalis TaxID=329112 RepID=UPI00247929CB|nr:uncharacterized protein LOC129767188 [Toxorhynchites rutilus septentrionalis]